MSKYIDIPKHLQTLLYEYSPVIIPSIGALNTRYKPAQLDETKGIITPPIKTLELNDRMAGNDGLLSSHIARTERITEAEAEVEIKIFTDVLLHKIETNGKATIEGIGEFYRDVTGGLGFLPAPKANFSADTYGLQNVDLGKFADAALALSNNEAIGAGVGTFSVVEEPIDDATSRTLAEKLSVAAESANGALISGNKLGSNDDANAKSNSMDKIASAIAASQQQDATKKNKNTWLKWLIPLLILLLFFGLLSRLSSGGGKTSEPSNKGIAQETNNANLTNNTNSTNHRDVAATEQNQSGNPANNPATNGTTTTPDGLHTIVDGITITNSQANEYVNTNASKGYYIIVGAWKNRAKAEEIAQIFKQQKYNVILLETNTGTMRIGIYVPQQTIPQVKSEYLLIREQNPDAWVLHYK